MTKFQRRSIYLSVSITILFLLYKYFISSGIIVHNRYTDLFEVIYFILTSVVTFKLFHDLITRNRKHEQNQLNSKKFNEVLLNQSYNPDYYSGNINQAAKTMTREAVETLSADRCSVWLYNKSRTSITCVELYVKSELLWYQDIKLYKKDYKPYFDYIDVNPIMIASDAETHPATECFTETYLKPLGIKSMLDVPVIYKGDVLGVVCIESYTKREWTTEELNFSQMLSSLYSFTHSVNESNKLSGVVTSKENQITNRMDAINRSNAVIEFDLNGNVQFANNIFLDLMGYSTEEIVGQHHSMFVKDEEKNTKEYSDFWNKLKKGQYFSGDITRVKKDGSLVYLIATYNPILNESGKTYRVMKIATDVTSSVLQQIEIEKKNTYLEHAAKIIRHDMHSGINTYIPRGVNSLERRLTPEDIKKLKIEAPLKMIREGLTHTQKVYKGVYEFTNLVKKDAIFHTSPHDLKEILVSYLNSTSYKSQVLISDLVTTDVNDSLFCTAIDNLIRNGLKYNDSDTKVVKIFMESDNTIIIQDNGRGMSQMDFEYLSRPYVRKEGQRETGTGLGLNICLAIMEEHGFELTCEKNNIGTKMKIKIK
jgi:PAS domain S-box-containing protein